MLVTGHEPLESVARMAGENQETANQCNPQVPPVVSDVIQRAMALEPGLRFQKAGEFRTALKAAQATLARAPQEENQMTMLVEPETTIQPALSPVVRVPFTGAESISQAVSMAPPASLPVSVPAPASGIPKQQPIVAKKKRSWLIYGIGGAAVLVLCIGAAVLVSSLFLSEGVSPENATLTYQADLKIAAQGTTTKLAADSASTIKATNTVAIKPTSTEQVKQNTATAQPKSTATVPAKSQATEQALQTYLATLESRAGLVFGPRSGRLLHKAENDTIETINASVGLRSFILEVTFLAPYSATEAPWDFGIIFRDGGPNIEYRLKFNSDKSWIFAMYSGSPEGKIILQGDLPDLNTTEDGPNKIRLYAEEDRGWLFVNDQFISELDLSKQYSGAIMIGIGFQTSTESTGKLTTYKDFSVWSLP